MVYGDDPVFIFFKHENFQPIYMPKHEHEEYPSVTLMVPNARLFFFFLVNSEQTLMDGAPSIYLTESEVVVRNSQK